MEQKSLRGRERSRKKNAEKRISPKLSFPYQVCACKLLIKDCDSAFLAAMDISSRRRTISARSGKEQNLANLKIHTAFATTRRKADTRNSPLPYSPLQKPPCSLRLP